MSRQRNFNNLCFYVIVHPDKDVFWAGDYWAQHMSGAKIYVKPEDARTALSLAANSLFSEDHNSGLPELIEFSAFAQCNVVLPAMLSCAKKALKRYEKQYRRSGKINNYYKPINDGVIPHLMQTISEMEND